MRNAKLFEPGDRVMVLKSHPHADESGTLVAYEKYGLGWMAWRVRLDTGRECYVNAVALRKARGDEREGG